MNQMFSFNRVLAGGMVFALILLGIAAIYALRVMEIRALNAQCPKVTANPLISRISNSDEIDSGTPDIPGVKVYSAERDMYLIQLDANEREREFRKICSAKIADEDLQKEQIMILKRDLFTAKRLVFLKALEAAKTKEERQKVLDEFKKNVTPTGNNE